MNVAARIYATSLGDWSAKGWRLVPGFLAPAQLAALRREAERLWDSRQLFGERGAIPQSATRSDRLDPVIDVSPPFAALAKDQALRAVVDGALGGPARLMKDKFIAKPPGAIGYATHQDAAYWPGLGVDGSKFLTAVIFLDDATAENGAIECAPGHQGSLLTDPDTIADPDEADLGPFETIEAKAGDLLLLHALTPHRSGPNRSQGKRRALLFTYGVDPRPNLYELYQQLRMGMHY
jgi:ectoine hydroxylase-related dioxygenase (phytanoyl-CoA dioxygenase family)